MPDSPDEFYDLTKQVPVMEPGTQANGLLVDVSRVQGTVTTTGPGSGTGNPAIVRLEDGTTTQLAKVGAIGNLFTDVSSIAGTSTNVLAGVAQNGTQRVVAAQDTTTIAGSAPGTAGTPSANVVTVQGIAGGTVVPINNSQVGGAAISTAASGTQKVGIASGATGNSFVEATAANLTAAQIAGAQLVTRPADATSMSAPAAGTLASASKAANASGRHVCTSVSAAFASDGTANGAAQNVTLVLRDGATGAGTILMTWTIGRTTTTATDFINQGSFTLSDLNIIGSTNTAMTLEFTGTASNHEIYTANLTTYDVS